MAEPEKDQIGDGQDNFGQAAGKAIQAAKQISHDAAAEAAVKGAEATANEDEDHLVRLLQPQEDTKYILVVPNMEFANKLILPDAPCLFATVDQTECEAPKITFYSS